MVSLAAAASLERKAYAMIELDREFVRALLPPRKKSSHKGDYGRVLIIAGSAGFTGAARLCALGAVRMGAGLVYVGTPRSCWPIVACGEPEPMVFPLPEDGDGRLSAEAFPYMEDRLSSCDVCVAGPGLGRSDGVSKLVRLIISAGKPLIIDADGINPAIGHINGCTTVLTPHEGEFLRAGGDLSGGREAGATAFADKHGCVLVLKGPGTLIASPDGRLARNTTGNPGLAKGGSGDLLAGMTGALAGQGIPAFEAAAAAAWLHGRAADICAERLGEISMTPSDVARAIPEALLEATG